MERRLILLQRMSCTVCQQNGLMAAEKANQEAVQKHRQMSVPPEVAVVKLTENETATAIRHTYCGKFFENRQFSSKIVGKSSREKKTAASYITDGAADFGLSALEQLFSFSHVTEEGRFQQTTGFSGGRQVLPSVQPCWPDAVHGRLQFSPTFTRPRWPDTVPARTDWTRAAGCNAGCTAG